MGLFTKRNKEAERFYLLPGQGGAAFRRKQRHFIVWSILVGTLVSAGLGVAMYLMNQPKP